MSITKEMQSLIEKSDEYLKEGNKKKALQLLYKAKAIADSHVQKKGKAFAAPTFLGTGGILIWATGIVPGLMLGGLCYMIGKKIGIGVGVRELGTIRYQVYEKIQRLETEDC